MTLKKNNHRTFSQFQGQSLVEFVLLLPLLLMLILGAMDFGRLFFTKMVITNAAREGANYLAYHPGDITGMESIIADEANSSTVEYSDLVIQPTGCCTIGQPVTVTISTTVDLVFDSVFEFLGMIDGPIQLTSSVEMMVLK